MLLHRLLSGGRSGVEDSFQGPEITMAHDAFVQLLGLVADAAILVIEADSTRWLTSAQGKGNPRRGRCSALGNCAAQPIVPNPRENLH